MGRGMKGLVTLVVIATLGLAAALVVRYFLQPGPLGRLVLAAGGSDGAYHQLALTYEKELARNGIKLELRDDVQGWQLLQKLKDDNSGIDGGIIKGGFLGSLTGRLASVRARNNHDDNVANTRSIGRLFLEPIWVFTRGDLPIESLRDLEGKKILTGGRESGARRVAMTLLHANGVNTENSVLIAEELTDEAKVLLSGQADAAVLVLPPEADRIQRLLRIPQIRLMNFAPEADAYVSRFPALTKVVLFRGAVEFDPVVPSADITLLASSAALIVRDELHPALASILAHAVITSPKSPVDKAGDPVLFHKAGQYPTADDPEYQVSPEVRLVYKTGELPFLLRVLAPLNQRFGLPFSFATSANAYGLQTVLLLIPALTILLPLARFVPFVYRWAVRQRLLYWYRELKGLERSLERSVSRDDLIKKLDEIDRIDLGVRRIRVPLEFSDQLYDLRGHIDLVQRSISKQLEPPRMAAE